jgi:hypothetical protein
MPRLVRRIWILLALHLGLGMFAYAHFLLTGQYTLLSWYFLVIGSLFFLIITATECYLAFLCRSWFDSDEPMRLTWSMIGCAALARLTGTLLREVSDGRLPWGSLHWMTQRPMRAFTDLGQMGMVIGGPLSMALLAIGLGRVLRMQRRFRMLGALTRGDQALLIFVVAFTISQIGLVLPQLHDHPSVGTMVLWLSDPLLSLLLIQAIMVRRSVIRVGQGLLARCWGMYVLAIVTTSIGDAALWASSHNLLSESLTALSWYIWFVAATAFAIAPAYQLTAISLTREQGL